MQDPGGVGGREAPAGFEPASDQRLQSVVVVALPPRERGTRDELLCKIHASLVVARVVDGHDVGVRDAGHQRGLAEEPFGSPHDPRFAGAHQLQRDVALELGVFGAVHHAHRTLAEPPFDDVAADAVLGEDRRVHARRAVGLRLAERARQFRDQSATLAALVDVELDVGALVVAEGALDVAADDVGISALHATALPQGPWRGNPSPRQPSRLTMPRSPRRPKATPVACRGSVRIATTCSPTARGGSGAPNPARNVSTLTPLRRA